MFGILRAEVRLHKGLSILKGNSVAKLVGINFQIGLLAFLLMLVINRSNNMGCKRISRNTISVVLFNIVQKPVYPLLGLNIWKQIF